MLHRFGFSQVGVDVEFSEEVKHDPELGNCGASVQTYGVVTGLEKVQLRGMKEKNNKLSL